MVPDRQEDGRIIHEQGGGSRTGSAGDYVAPIGNTGENFRRIVAAGFEAIPEPGSAVLLLSGLGGLLLRRNRG